MKRSVLVLFVTLLALVLAGCQPAAPDTNRNDAVATASPAKGLIPLRSKLKYSSWNVNGWMRPEQKMGKPCVA